ncbi:alpha/beta hydrolase family protein [Flavobacterium sp.]|uniref:alpha/beta hydrolase family protein n=1 Tax=Flavobacterium sp. TaxID=239 RepID=UPI0039E5A4AC
MSKRLFLFLILGLMGKTCFSCTPDREPFQKSLLQDTLTLFDQQRNRKIPIAIYHSNAKNVQNKIPVILNHGYGKNKGGDYLKYSYIAETLAARGYFVISIQHELPTDELMPTSGKPQEVRLPFWERGVQNISFVVGEMKIRYPELHFPQLVLIGHSNGGDTSMLLGQKFPELADKIISLDNRRMALPRTKQPKIYTIRSVDFPADEGVLPNEAERREFAIRVDFSKVPHNNMGDSGSEEEKRYLIGKVLEYLQY